MAGARKEVCPSRLLLFFLYVRLARAALSAMESQVAGMKPGAKRHTYEICMKVHPSEGVLPWVGRS